MEDMENVTLNQKEQARPHDLNSLLAEHMTIEQVSMLMGVSIRHTWRILSAYRKNGAAALAHGHRGRGAPNAISEATKIRTKSTLTLHCTLRIYASHSPTEIVAA